MKEIPVGAMVTAPKKLELYSYVEKGGIEVSVGLLQKVALLGTARILRRVFGGMYRCKVRARHCAGMW